MKPFQILCSVCLVLCGVQVQADGLKPKRVEGEVLIRVRAAQDKSALKTHLKNGYGQIARQMPQIHAYRLKLKRGLTIEAAIKQLKKDGNVVTAEPNRYVHACAVPNDDLFNSQQYGPKNTYAYLAWDIWKPQAQVVLAIVDTGVDYNHPDLTNKIFRDVTGAVIGYNFAYNTADPMDDYSHGTHCAGVAAAQINNSIGIAGIAGWDGSPGSSDTSYIKIMPVKVLDSRGDGTDEQVADGVIWAADHGAKIISLSLGDTMNNDILESSVEYAWSHGVLVVAAAGNEGNSNYFYPAASPNVLSVGATDTSNVLASFSTYGDWVLVGAPGYNVISMVPNNGYGYKSGTSMSCPHVVGEAALLLSQCPALTNVQLKGLITYYTSPYIPYGGRMFAPGAGYINVFTALQGAGLYVDKTATGPEQGTPVNPYHTLAAALTAASTTYNTNVFLRAGNYDEQPTVTKPVTLLNWTNTGIAQVGAP